MALKLEDVADAIAEETGAFVRAEIERAKAELRAEFASDPTTKTLTPTWRGIWREDQAYAIGALVTHANALWIAERPTVLRPGTPDCGWKLAVKSPR